MTRVSFLPGVFVASLLIGAIVAVGGLLAALLKDGDPALTLASAPFVIIFAVPVGFVVSIAPNILGAALLAWGGRDNIALRLPVMWALAGAGTGGALTLVLGTDGPPAGLLPVIGAASALLCRWKTRWTDNATTEEACHEQERPQPARTVARPRPHAADRWLD